MIKYLVSDLLKALRWLPLGVLFTVVFLLATRIVKPGRERKKFISDEIFTAVFAAYLFVVLCITFWSRESGSNRGFDMRVGSTWGINARNNAYVLENILLFVPLGFLTAQVFKVLKNIFYCTLAGFLFSFFIEVIQLLTGRGYFQIDDIITNSLGMFLGGLLFCVMHRIFKN